MRVPSVWLFTFPSALHHSTQEWPSFKHSSETSALCQAPGSLGVCLALGRMLQSLNRLLKQDPPHSPGIPGVQPALALGNAAFQCGPEPSTSPGISLPPLLDLPPQEADRAPWPGPLPEREDLCPWPLLHHLSHLTLQPQDRTDQDRTGQDRTGHGKHHRGPPWPDLRQCCEH